MFKTTMPIGWFVAAIAISLVPGVAEARSVETGSSTSETLARNQIAEPVAIRSIHVAEAAPGAEVVIEADGQLLWTQFRNEAGDLVLELPNTLLDQGAGVVANVEGLLAAVDVLAVSDSSRPLTRLVVTTTAETEHSLEVEQGKLVLRFVPIHDGTGRLAAAAPPVAQDPSASGVEISESDVALEPSLTAAQSSVRTTESTVATMQESELQEPESQEPVVADPMPEPLRLAAEASDRPTRGTPEQPLRGPEPIGAPARSLVGIEAGDSIEAGGGAGGSNLKVLGDGDFRYSSFFLDDPPRFVIDLEGVRTDGSSLNLSIDDPRLDRVRTGQFRSGSSPVARVVVDLVEEELVPSLRRQGNVLWVDFDSLAGAASKSSAPIQSEELAEAGLPQTEGPESQPLESMALEHDTLESEIQVAETAAPGFTADQDEHSKGTEMAAAQTTAASEVSAGDPQSSLREAGVESSAEENFSGGALAGATQFREPVASENALSEPQRPTSPEDGQLDELAASFPDSDPSFQDSDPSFQDSDTGAGEASPSPAVTDSVELATVDEADALPDEELVDESQMHARVTVQVVSDDQPEVLQTAREPLAIEDRSRIEAPASQATTDVELFEAQEVEIQNRVETRNDPNTTTFGVQPIGGNQQWVGDPITMSLRDADISEVLRTIARLSDLNLVIQPGVRGPVTVELVQVPWDQALDQILKVQGLGMELEGNILRIAPISQLQVEAQARQELARARSLATPLRTIMKRLSYARAREIERILTTGRVSALSGRFSFIQDRGLLSGRGSIRVDERTNTLILQELPSYLDTIIQVIENLDIPEKQVMIEARIVETNRTFSRSLGIQWRMGGVSNNAYGNSTGLTFPNNAAGTTGVNLLRGGTNGFLGLSFGNVLNTFQLDVTLTAAEGQGLVNVISAPRIATLNNRSAEIVSGLQIPVRTISATNVGIPISNVSLIDATLRLAVTPQVTAEGTILLDIELLKNEAQPGLLIAGSDGTPISTRRARTRVLVRDGGTTVIGGIYEVSSNEGEDSVPGLSNIPIIKYLFKNKERLNENEELLIFITPRVLRL